MDSFNYSTVEGDRFDSLASRFYGDTSAIKVLVEANPEVPVTATFPIGTKLIIPVLEGFNNITNDKLPPWKR